MLSRDAVLAIASNSGVLLREAPGLSPRRVAMQLSRPIEIDGVTLASIAMRAPDLPDLLLLPHWVRDDDNRAKSRWVALLASIPPSGAQQMCEADLQSAWIVVERGLRTLRPALDPRACDFSMALERPVPLGNGLQLSEVSLRPPLLSDYAVMGWTGWLATATRTSGDFWDVKTDHVLVMRWAARLSGIETEVLRKLSLADARRVFDEVASLVCGFSVLVLAYH